MKVIRFSLFILLVCLAGASTGCGSKKAEEPVEIITAENFLKLRKGMTISEVKCILGEPTYFPEGERLDDNQIVYCWYPAKQERGKSAGIKAYCVNDVVIKLEQTRLGPKRE